jgi:uncharacterized membrane protein YgaE (UPF0421/DUF939 family)
MWTQRIKLMALGGIVGSLLFFLISKYDPAIIMAIVLSLIAIWLEVE